MDYHTEYGEVSSCLYPVITESTEVPDGEVHLDVLYDEVVYPVRIVTLNVESILLAWLNAVSGRVDANRKAGPLLVVIPCNRVRDVNTGGAVEERLTGDSCSRVDR